ncbi:MAG TPA: RnfABCDGE type electron transport complex subunit B [Victivallales bacterium]|nr:RnfABCDGE type electron transport complex subunit B [Victivallales bacterium]HPO90897.1 RnfABCDGE type electron transport complex subunit B [Victivallales bacterium]HRR27925.1 RnfABCDGE type electron transport complex subunit B [Victivallales bacterium]HRU00372.1 RnfABCDGE type electron transport complex subunit B [Victivallales bacterium]
MIILYSILILCVVALILGLSIGITAKYFLVEQDPQVEKILSLLPGANCGGCGFAGCSDFAKSLSEGKAEVEGCPVASAEVRKLIAQVLGKSVSDYIRKVAVVLCGGSNNFARKISEYNGIADCRSANIIAGGGKACRYGCLGFASCARVCPVNAIEICDGLAVVHSDICIGCGKCVKACPRNLIKLVPETITVHVFCSSKDKGVDKKKLCDVPCIGCRKCVKVAGEDEMLVDGFLVRTNYEKGPAADLPLRAGCPTNCLGNSFPYSYKKLSKGLIEEKVA